MRTGRTWMLRPGWAWLIVIGCPALADAQLFPNLPIRRERPAPPEELPVYGLYRKQFYGYFPTCWRRFPPGWGCPSPEIPNWDAELARQPLDIPGEQDGPVGLDEPRGGAADPFEPGGGGDLPALPRMNSPFELDGPGAGGGNPPPLADPPKPAVDEDRPPAVPSPFDLPGGTSLEALPSVTPPVTQASERTYIPEQELAPPSLDELNNAPELADVSPPIEEVVGQIALAHGRPLSAPSAEFAPNGQPPPFPPGVNPGMIVDAPEGWGDGPVTLPEGAYIEAPPSRPAGRVRGFLSGLFYGRGLRR